jgi:hypothetical protein
VPKLWKRSVARGPPSGIGRSSSNYDPTLATYILAGWGQCRFSSTAGRGCVEDTRFGIRVLMGGLKMSMLDSDPKQVEQLEAELREVVQRDLASVRTDTNNADAIVVDITSLLKREFTNSVQDLEKNISRLEMLRDKLRDQGARVQRQIAEYAILSQRAIQSTKLIAESLNSLKSTWPAPALSEGAELPHWLTLRNLEGEAVHRGSPAVPPQRST